MEDILFHIDLFSSYLFLGQLAAKCVYKGCPYTSDKVTKVTATNCSFFEN